MDISEDKLYYQAPVSFRRAPRVFGYYRRVVEQAKELASISLQTSSNNPAFVDGDALVNKQAIISNGGYQNPYSAATIDSLTRSLADVAQILISVNNRVVEMSGGLLDLEPEPEVSTLYHVAAGWGEEIKAVTSPSIISLSNGGQTDTGTNDLLAWRKAMDATMGLEAILSVLAITSTHLIARKNIKPNNKLQPIYQSLITLFPLKTSHIDFYDKVSNVKNYLFEDSPFN